MKEEYDFFKGLLAVIAKSLKLKLKADFGIYGWSVKILNRERVVCWALVGIGGNNFYMYPLFQKKEVSKVLVILKGFFSFMGFYTENKTIKKSRIYC